MYSSITLKDLGEVPCGHSLIHLSTFLPKTGMESSYSSGFVIMAQQPHHSTLALLIVMHPLFVAVRWIIRLLP